MYVELPELQNARVRVSTKYRPIPSFSTVFNEQIEFPTPGQLKTGPTYCFTFCLYLFFFSFLEIGKQRYAFFTIHQQLENQFEPFPASTVILSDLGCFQLLYKRNFFFGYTVY